MNLKRWRMILLGLITVCIGVLLAFSLQRESDVRMSVAERAMNPWTFGICKIKAYLLDDRICQYKLAMHYHSVLLDSFTAEKWLNKAVDQGNANAQYELAELFLLKSSRAEDRARGVNLLKDAASRGQKNAKLRLSEMERVAIEPQPAERK